MIAARKPECIIADDLFNYARHLVLESGVAELIDDQRPPSPRPTPRPATTLA